MLGHPTRPVLVVLPTLITLACSPSGGAIGSPPVDGLTVETWSRVDIGDGPHPWAVLLGDEAFEDVKRWVEGNAVDVVLTAVRFPDEATRLRAVTPPTSQAEGTGELLKLADWLRTDVRDAVLREHTLSNVLRDQSLLGIGLSGTGAALVGLRGEFFTNGVGCHPDLVHGGNPSLQTAEALTSLDVPGGAVVIYGEPYADPESLVPPLFHAVRSQGPQEVELLHLIEPMRGEVPVDCLTEGLRLALRGRVEPWGDPLYTWLASPLEGSGCNHRGRSALFAPNPTQPVRLAIDLEPPVPPYTLSERVSWASPIGEEAAALVEVLDVPSAQDCWESSFAGDFPHVSNRVGWVTEGMVTASLSPQDEMYHQLEVQLLDGVLDTGWESVLLEPVTVAGPVLVDPPE